jgi:cytochrome c-type biogenesis protein
MDPFQISYPGALLAGLLSFASPCVLPLVPAYLSFLSGASFEQLTEGDAADKGLQRRVFIAALAFVLGFGTVFVIFGATATALSKAVAENLDILSKIAGVVIAVFGLHYMGVFRIGFLNYERRCHIEKKPSGFIGAYVLGLAFAFGWTPCVGPVLASILLVAASGDTIWYGTGLLAAYAIGIGAPFLVAALFVKPFMAFMARFRKHIRKVEIAIGLLLLITGIAIFTGSLADVGQWMLETFPAFGRVG